MLPEQFLPNLILQFWLSAGSSPALFSIVSCPRWCRLETFHCKYWSGLHCFAYEIWGDDSVWPSGCRLLQMITMWIRSSAYLQGTMFGILFHPLPTQSLAQRFCLGRETCCWRDQAGRLPSGLCFCLEHISFFCSLYAYHKALGEWQCLEVFWLQLCHCLFSSVSWFTGLHSLHWIRH